MFKHYAVSDNRGEILQIIGTQNHYSPCEPDVSDTTHYVDIDTGVIKEKQELYPLVRVDGLVVNLSGIPVGTKVSTNNVEGLVDSIDTDIQYDTPGTYKIRLEGLVDFLEKTLEVTVGDP